MASPSLVNTPEVVCIQTLVPRKAEFDRDPDELPRLTGLRGEYRKTETREEWLLRLVDALRGTFQEIGHPLPEQVRVTCGWPSRAALPPSHRRIGECWSSQPSADHTVEIFISPCLGQGIDAAETLVHELVHAAGALGHRGQFPAIAKTLGIKKPWRATTATPGLRERLNGLIATIGPYPHATLDMSMTPHRKDGTRLRKLACPSAVIR